MIDPVIIGLICAGGALLFASACAHKLRHARTFAATLMDYRLVPQPLVPLAAAVVMILEGTVAAALLWPGLRELGCVVGAAVLSVYGLAIGVNLARGRRAIECGCSLRPRPICAAMIARNGLLAGLLLLALSPTTERSWTWPDVLTLTAGICAAAIVYAAADTLMERRWLH